MSLLPNAVARGRYVVTPNSNLRTPMPFIQTIELFDGEQSIASASWFSTANDGVVQILDIRVIPELQRKGVGTSLFKQVQLEADRFMRSRNVRLRRIFCITEQKTHIIARGFLTGLGFHHVQTIANSLKNEDLLVYLLGCD
jgi:ribosomal protein S18 acetylase RimI-like enzyme